MKVTEEMLTEGALEVLDMLTLEYILEHYERDVSGGINKLWHQYRVERMMPMGMVFFTEDPSA